MKPREIIIRPLITEKTTMMQELENTVCFEVDRRANKIMVRKAVEELFNVKVEKVRILNVKGKAKPVTILEPIGLESELSVERKAAVKAFHDFLKLYRGRRWDEAHAALGEDDVLHP